MKKKLFNTIIAFVLLITLCAAGLPVQKTQAAEEEMPEAGAEELAKPVVAKLKNTYRGIDVAWSKSEGADHYCVYRKQTDTVTNHKNDKDWEKIAETDTEEYSDNSGLTSAYKYAYKVQAVGTGGSGESIVSPVSESRQIYRMQRPSVRVYNNNKTLIGIGISNVGGPFDGIIVYRKGPGESSYTKVAVYRISSYTDWDVKPGETYSYKICSVRNKSRSTVSKEKTVTCGKK